MMKNDVFDKRGYQKISSSKLLPILAGLLTPAMYFGNMIHITVFMKTVGLSGKPKMTKKMIFLTQNHYITNNNWKLWDFLVCYLSLTVDFDNMIHITAFMKTIGYREPKITLLKYKKNAVFDEYDYITNNHWKY